jgi:hypothetical protein
MKFYYKDRAAARQMLQERLEIAENNLTKAQHTLRLAKQHLQDTPNSWKYCLSIQDPHTNAKLKVEDANWELYHNQDAVEKARLNLDVFDKTSDWDFVEIDGGK